MTPALEKPSRYDVSLSDDSKMSGQAYPTSSLYFPGDKLIMKPTQVVLSKMDDRCGHRSICFMGHKFETQSRRN